nr:phospho-N-acetylmuramoyl-pentapeptide-transferase [Victivallales bacterium]
GSSEVVIFAMAISGACIGFLWFNCHPASMFMGDTGSLALGGSIGLIAVLVKQEVNLLIIGGVFVIEALSVIIQVLSFKLTGKRVFLCSPLHHHFERKGWTETQIVVRFWILAGIFAILGIASLKIR